MDDPSVDRHLWGDPSSSVLSDQLLADQEALAEEATTRGYDTSYPYTPRAAPSHLQELFQPSRPSTFLLRRRPSPTRPRTEMLTFEWDIRNLEYVSEVDENLLCAICRCPFETPMRLRCEHVFCRSCLFEALNHQPEGKTCPSCRRPAPHEYIVPAHRIIHRILDDLEVKCPLHILGCTDTTPRGSVQTHIDRYCGYESVICPLESCSLTLPRRLAEEGACLHYTTYCSDCDKEMMELDLHKHQERFCTSVSVECTGCKAKMLQTELDSHKEHTCPATIISCTASEYGCDYTSSRCSMSNHTSICHLAKLVPFLQTQNARIEEHTTALKTLQERSKLHDEFLDTVRETLAGLPPISSLEHHPDSSTTDDPSSISPSNIALEPYASSSSSGTLQPVSTQRFTTPTSSHLLHLHESLRAEFSRLTRALSDLDAKTDLAFLNASLRQKDEMAHRDAALAQVRAQMQWLVNGRLVRERGRAQAWQGRGGAGTVGSGPVVVGNEAARRGGGSGSAIEGEWEVGGGIEGRMSRRASDGGSVSGREKL